MIQWAYLKLLSDWTAKDIRVCTVVHCSTAGCQNRKKKKTQNKQKQKCRIERNGLIGCY